jgi:hypothetical protein
MDASDRLGGRCFDVSDAHHGELKQISEAQAEIASLQQEVLEARDISIGQAGAECNQARRSHRILY